jgi:hypothetical protein
MSTPESTYQVTGTFAAIVRNARWLPHAQAVLVHAPATGAASWHTLWTQFQIGDLYVERGSLGQALEAYRAGQGLAERLAQSDPSNAGWQRDLSASYWKQAEITEADQPAEARAWWQKCHDQLAAMKTRGILNPPDEKFLVQARAKVEAAAAEMDAGEAAGQQPDRRCGTLPFPQLVAWTEVP